MFFEVQNRIFMQLITFQPPSSVSVSPCLLKSWWKNKSVSRSFWTVGSLSKCCCQCPLLLSRRKFEHSWKSFSFKCPFLPLFLNKKIKINTRNTMASSYHSRVMSTQTMKVPFFVVWVVEFSIISSCLGKKFFVITLTWRT